MVAFYLWYCKIGKFNYQEKNRTGVVLWHKLCTVRRDKNTISLNEGFVLSVPSRIAHSARALSHKAKLS